MAWVAAAVSLRDKRFRPVAAISLVAVLAYAALLREGSGGHQYWNYWGLVPAAVGVAYVYTFLDAAVRRRWPSQVGARTAVLVGVAVVVGLINLSQPNDAKDLIEIGAYVSGTNPDVDRAVALHLAMDQFLRQGMDERCSSEEAWALAAAILGSAQ